MYAIIGGSGTAQLYPIEEETVVETGYGKVSVYRTKTRGKDLLFLPRHGVKHNVPPHEVDYRANILALKNLKVDGIIATNAVGSLRKEIPPGSLVVAIDFLDFTKGRPLTLFEEGVVHTDMTAPYDPRIIEALKTSAENLGIGLKEVVYVATEGPRYETPAEIKMFRLLGGDVVGMTGVPEVVFAREASVPYASLCVVTNYAAGMQDRISHDEVIKLMEEKGKIVKEVMDGAIEVLEG